MNTTIYILQYKLAYVDYLVGAIGQLATAADGEVAVLEGLVGPLEEVAVDAAEQLPLLVDHFLCEVRLAVRLPLTTHTHTHTPA